MKQKSKKNNKIECSKKLAWFSGICFGFSIVFSIGIFTYCAIMDRIIDFTLPITLVTVTGAVFGVTMASYANKSRYENVTKIQQGYLREKYKILKNIGVLNMDRAIQELEDGFSEMENDFNNEKSMSNQEINYNG